MTKFFGDEPDNADDFIEVTDGFSWEGCPKCNSMNAEYLCDTERDADGRYGSQWRCQGCGHVFIEKNWKR